MEGSRDGGTGLLEVAAVVVNVVETSGEGGSVKTVVKSCVSK